MKNLIVFALLLGTSGSLFAQSSESSSPYFMVYSADSTPDVLPLKSTDVSVRISGVIADVEVVQTYANEGHSALEAIYVFPGSVHAAVYGMQMKVGQRLIEAELQEKNQARATYTAAKAKGQRTSLLEQHRPNVFQMNVANILPGDIIEVRLQYTELLVPENGIYQFVYPTVVGPRYISGKESTNTSYANQPYQHSGEKPLSTFGINVSISSGIPIQMVQNPTHPSVIAYPDPRKAEVKLGPSRHGNRDFVLNYSLRGQEIETGLMLFEGEKENFFLCMVEPPQKVNFSKVPPREYIFVVDVSGSMHGFPLEVSKKLMENLLCSLRPYDFFNIILFAGRSSVLSPTSLQATPMNIEQALQTMMNQQGGGGTNLLPALERSLNFPQQADGVSRSIVVITDGYIGMEPEAFDLIRRNLNRANVFAFGIGSSVNRHLIDGLAEVGKGVPAIILNPQEAAETASKFQQYISEPLFSQVNYEFNGFDAYDVEPITLPDVLAQRPVILFGKYKGQPKGEIIISGYTGSSSTKLVSATIGDFGQSDFEHGELKEIRMQVSHSKPAATQSALRYLWARAKLRRINDFQDYNISPEKILEITNHGLAYNLLTNYTSFVAVERNRSRDKSDSLVTINQPLPMPENVSDYAIGFSLNITGVTGPLTNGIPAWVLIMIFPASVIMLLLIVRAKRINGIVMILGAVFFLTSCQSKSDSADLEIADCPEVQTVTFILGKDDQAQNRYYENATAFFAAHAKDGTEVVVTHIHSLEEVHEYLSHAFNGNTPLHKINLVVHGNPWTGMAVPIFRNESNRTTAAGLAEVLDQKRFDPFSAQVIDCQTQVHVLGCSLGQDTALTQQVQRFFTNEFNIPASVCSSKNFTLFTSTPGKFANVEQKEAISYYLTYSSQRKPSAEELADAFEQKYPDIGVNWIHAVQTTSAAGSTDPFLHTFSIPVDWTFCFKHEQEVPQFKWQDHLLAWIAKQPELIQSLETIQLSCHDFWWVAKPTRQKTGLWQSQPALSVKGYSRAYCVLVPIPTASSATAITI